ncbi:uncharacterized protein CBL_07775 [Carabus blaptoides fortunei]
MYLSIWQLSFIFYISVQGASNNECGSVRKSSDRIVNGRDVGYVKYSWYAALYTAKSNNLMCGGSLISSRFILTAAHCFKPFATAVSKGKLTYESLYVIKLGISNKCIPERTQEVFGVTKVYIHEEYFKQQPYYDITLVKLDAKAANFMPICLPTARYESNNRSRELGVIIGLGREASNAFGLPCTLKQAEVPIQPDTVCKQMLQSMKLDESKMIGAFCAGYVEGGTDTCQGDSGGPLQVRMSSEEEVYMILGITSFGFGCAKENLQGVYTDVSHYLNWIREKMHLENEILPIKSLNSLPTTSAAVTPSTTPRNYAKRVHHARPKKYKNIIQLLLDI